MASFVYTPSLSRMGRGSFDWVGQDIRCLLVMSNTTADTDQDLENIGDIGTLDEMDGSGYVRKAAANEADSQDDANNRLELSFDPITWSALGNGTRAVVGMVIYQHVTNDADALLIAYVDLGTINPGGADLTITNNAQGIIQIAAA